MIRRLDEAEALLAHVADDDPQVADAATHDVRIRCKEVRALLRLIRDVDSAERRRVDAWVDRAGASLGARRDAQVIADVVRDLTGETGRLEPEPADVTASAQRLLRRARRHVERWQTGPRRSPIVDGVAHSYRLARRRYAAVVEAPEAEAVHAWRRAVKRLGYQVRAVRAWAPDELGAIAAQLDRLGTLLGDHHDLANAIVHIARHSDDVGSAAAISLAHDRQADLEQQAVRIGTALFSTSPRRFERRLRAWSRADPRVSS